MASLCTGKVIRGYWLDGELPADGLVCPTSEKLFPSPESDTKSLWLQGDGQNPDDLQILEKMKSLGEAIQPFLMQRK